MPTPTPEAWAQIRYAYEHTDTTIDRICAEHHISSGTLRDRMRRWGWTRRRPPISRDGPPAVPMTPPLAVRGERAAAGAERGWPSESAPPYPEDDETPPHPMSSLDPDIDLSPHGSPNSEPSLAYAGRGAPAAPDRPIPTTFAPFQTVDAPAPAAGHEQMPADPATVVPRLQNAVTRLLPAIETVVARLAAGAHHPREMEHAGRALSSLTRALRELNGLLVQHQASVVEPGSEIPTDMIAFRMELARRLNVIVERMQQNDEEAKPEET
ncbi:MAG: hypothetical protein GC182_05580 [Rhodopseudomonas sp.]|nr:hypothetical protein [Rhodopseudomonas sp.]